MIFTASPNAGIAFWQKWRLRFIHDTDDACIYLVSEQQLLDLLS